MSKKKDSPIKSYKLKNGDLRYEFQVYLGVDPLTGNQKNTTRRSFKKKSDAKIALARIKVAVANGTYRQERAETFLEVYNLWVVQYKKTVEESTFVKTTGLFRNHILPAMGAYKIEKIHVDICQKHVDEWASKLKGFNKVKAYAAMVLDFAIKRDYIKINPFTHVFIPTNPKRINVIDKKEVKKNFYTKEELISFLSLLEKESNYKMYAFFRLLAYTGIRKGEAFALTWTDIDFEKNEICIDKAIASGDKRLYLKSTKNKENRIISMDEETMTILKKWKKKQKEDYFILGFDTSQPTQLVFSNTKNEYIQPSKTSDWLSDIQKQFPVDKITAHGFRHTHCTLLFEAGASLKEVQDRIGHKDVQTTLNIYTHVTKNAKKGAMMKFANYVAV